MVRERMEKLVNHIEMSTNMVVRIIGSRKNALIFSVYTSKLGIFKGHGVMLTLNSFQNDRLRYL